MSQQPFEHRISGTNPTTSNQPAAPERVTQCIQDWPDESVLLSLVGGLAVGVVVGMAIAGPESSRRWRDRRTAEGLGNRLMAAIDRGLPDSVLRQLGIHK